MLQKPKNLFVSLGLVFFLLPNFELLFLAPLSYLMQIVHFVLNEKMVPIIFRQFMRDSFKKITQPVKIDILMSVFGSHFTFEANFKSL